jgi:hypothetical protein
VLSSAAALLDGLFEHPVELCSARRWATCGSFLGFEQLPETLSFCLRKGGTAIEQNMIGGGALGHE